MSYDEKGTWVYLVYLVIIAGRLASTPAAEVSYVPVLLRAVGGSVLKLVAYRRGL